MFRRRKCSHIGRCGPSSCLPSSLPHSAVEGIVAKPPRPQADAHAYAEHAFIAANWLTFIYAVASRQVVQSSLGYFVSPLANVLLGVLFLGERLRKCQILSIGLALVGGLLLAALAGEVPEWPSCWP